ncbi:MAG: glycoside hydrolase family 88 protein [Anaerobacillus sp.]|uniref:glycoside hydrolase family 88 protein n=1 Tax=Anaerobacillus sp. TaxID=1872506 RepID=UPI00391AC443
MFLQEILILFLGIITVIMLIDVVPIFKDWLNRIHIGRYINKIEWKRSITEVGINWLNKTPKIKVTDNTRLVVIDMLKGNYTKSTIQHWQEAAILLGLAEHVKNSNDENCKQEIIKYLDNKFDKQFQWAEKPIHVDGAILAYAIMKLNFIETDKYKPALDYVWELIKEHTGEDGTVGYRKSMMNYRYVDTIGFICPFLVAYGVKYNKEECIDLAVKQLKEYEIYGMLGQHHIPCHAYKVDNKVPLGLYGWGRGLGWYAIGLIDAWNELPEKHKYKPLLEDSVRVFAKAIIGFQQPNGSWNWTITRTEARPDSSTTATLAWFLINASKTEGLSALSIESAEKAINYLMSVTRRYGAVDFSQGDTKDIGVYSMLFSILPFTQGFCIRIINHLNIR